jgi:hypothetical protein
MKETTLAFHSWSNLWTFQRSVGVHQFSIMFRTLQLTGCFSKGEVDRAVNVLDATIKENNGASNGSGSARSV